MASSEVSIERLAPAGHPFDWASPVGISLGLKVANAVFVSGQVAVDERGGVVGVGDVDAQLHAIFSNIGMILAEAGADFSHVVKLNTYYVLPEGWTDVKAFYDRMAAVRLDYLKPPGPAATAVRVVGLSHPDWLFEVDAVAIVPTTAK